MNFVAHFCSILERQAEDGEPIEQPGPGDFTDGEQPNGEPTQPPNQPDNPNDNGGPTTIETEWVNTDVNGQVITQPNGNPDNPSSSSSWTTPGNCKSLKFCCSV